MLSLLKKKPEANALPLLPPWHPNFRNVERLPDTKVVRTAFFVNGGAVAVAAIMLLWVARQEYQLHDLGNQITDWQTRIDRDKHASDTAIARYKKFQTEAARLDEIDAFVKSRPFVSELVLRLGQTLPPNVALDTLEVRDNGVSLRATVRGAPELASGYASAYLQALRADSAFSALFDDVQLVNLGRNAQTGRLAAEFFLKFKGIGKDGKRS